MITIQRTFPVDTASGVYLDDSIILTFSAELESSYLSDEFFQLYRTNADLSEFFERIDVDIFQTNYDVTINPVVELSLENYYVLIVVGGASGIQSVGGDTLAENETVHFCTGTALRPTSPVTSTINEIELYVDGSTGTVNLGAETESYDLFTASGEGAPIHFISSMPADRSVGIRSLSRISFLYDDNVASPVPVNALSGRWNDLPFDLDPFGDRSVTPSAVSIAGRAVAFDVAVASGEFDNREYIFTLAPNSVHGLTNTDYDRDGVTIRLLGPLSPLYASPAQIRARLSEWSDNASVDISDYELYKLIHEKSRWFIERTGVTITTETMMAVNRIIICYVLLELVGSGRLLFTGGVKKRRLLATDVEYYQPDLGAITDQLKECVNEASGLLNIQTTIMTGIKSGGVMHRPTKRYGVYR